MDRGLFGQRLASERRKLGLTIEQVGVSTRIRTRFIAAFEKGDFAAMPPFGYAQNMLASYARFLDLDPTPILEDFREQYAQYEEEHIGTQRDISRTTVSEARPVRRGSYTQPNSNTRSSRSASTDAYLNHHGSRRLSGQGTQQGSRSKGGTAGRKRTAQGRSPAYTSANPRKLGKRSVAGKSSYNALKEPLKGPNMKLIIGAVAVLVVLVLIIWGITSCSSRRKASQTETTPNTGVTVASPAVSIDPSVTPGASGSPAVSQSAGEPFTISFTVADSTVSDISVTVDGATAYSGTAAGPLTKSFSVTQSVQMTIGAPDNVTVKRDDTVVSPRIDDNGQGLVDLSVS